MFADVPRSTRNPVARIWSSSAVRYVVVGGFAFVFDVALLWLLHEMLGISLAISAPVAFLASFAVTYTLQRLVAFRSDEAVLPSVIRYTLLVAFNTVATTGIVWAANAAGLPWESGKVIAVAATTVWNYFAYRHWVFPTRKAL